MSNTLIATALNDHCRIYITNTKEVIETARKFHNLFPTSCAALGRTLSVTGLMAIMQNASPIGSVFGFGLANTLGTARWKYAFLIDASIMMGFNSSDDESYATILSGFSHIGIKHSFMYLYKDPIVNKYQDEFQTDEFLYLKVVQMNDDLILPKDRNQMIPISDIFEKAFSYMKEPTQLVMINISVGEVIYGVLLCEMPYEMFLYYESIISLFYLKVYFEYGLLLQR